VQALLDLTSAGLFLLGTLRMFQTYHLWVGLS
jgi:hypothetical protein